jgi:hypothetical protein
MLGHAASKALRPSVVSRVSKRSGGHVSTTRLPSTPQSGSSPAGLQGFACAPAAPPRSRAPNFSSAMARLLPISPSRCSSSTQVGYRTARQGELASHRRHSIGTTASLMKVSSSRERKRNPQALQPCANLVKLVRLLQDFTHRIGIESRPDLAFIESRR